MRPHTAKLIDAIRAGRKSRHALAQHEANAHAALKQGDADAPLVLDALKRAVPTDPYFWFLGFCPNADVGNRLDTEWRAQGICTCTIDRFDESRGQERQIEDFMNIRIGDRLILKKDKKRGHTMTLHGYGRVTALAEDGATQPRYIERSLIVDWAAQAAEIEVPFMGCTATVNWRDADRVEREMPAEFFAWLGEEA
jgi:hypothetical protein